MELSGERASLRFWEPGDAEAILRHANNWNVARNLSNVFPHPYTEKDAQAFLERCQRATPEEPLWAVVADGAPIGGMGIHPLRDDRRHTAEIGYWLGEAYWGRGIATELVGLASTYAFERLGVERLEAYVFIWNPASARVLEKNGYELEGTLRRRAFKDRQFVDEWLYARIRSSR